MPQKQKIAVEEKVRIKSKDKYKRGGSESRGELCGRKDVDMHLRK